MLAQNGLPTTIGMVVLALVHIGSTNFIARMKWVAEEDGRG
jgi:hypothetical protein